MHNSGITLGVFVSWHAFEHTRTQNPGVRNLCVTHAGVLGVFQVTGVSVFRTFSLIPLLCRPSHDDLDYLGYKKQANRATEVLAHRFHIAVLELDRGDAHKPSGKEIIGAVNDATVYVNTSMVSRREHVLAHCRWLAVSGRIRHASDDTHQLRADQPVVCAFRSRFNHFAEDVCEGLVECSRLGLIEENPLTSDAEDHAVRARLHQAIPHNGQRFQKA